MSKIKMAAMNRKYIYSSCIFGCVRNSNNIPMAMPVFSRSGISHEISHILAYIHDRNEIQTAIPMFSRSGNTTEVLRKMPDIRIADTTKMAAINQK